MLYHALFSSATLGLRITHCIDYIALNCVLYGSLRGWKGYAAVLGYVQAVTQWVGAMILVGIFATCHRYQNRTRPVRPALRRRDGSTARVTDEENEDEREPDEETPLVPVTTTTRTTQSPPDDTTALPRRFLLRITIFTLFALSLSFFTLWFLIRPGNAGTTDPPLHALTPASASALSNITNTATHQISTSTWTSYTQNIHVHVQKRMGPVLDPWDIFFILFSVFIFFCTMVGLSFADIFFVAFQFLSLSQFLTSFPFYSPGNGNGNSSGNGNGNDTRLNDERFRDERPGYNDTGLGNVDDRLDDRLDDRQGGSADDNNDEEDAGHDQTGTEASTQAEADADADTEAGANTDGYTGTNTRVSTHAIRAGAEWLLLGLSFVVLGVAQFCRPLARDSSGELFILLGSFASETAYLVFGMGISILGAKCVWRGYERRSRT